MEKNTKPIRLQSLDVLRGFTLFLLVFFQPVLVAFLGKFDDRWSKAILYQLDHEVWVGFRFWDLIMPMFLFVVGVAMPFSFSKYLSGAKTKLYWKILRRFIILFIFGMIVQGNLLSFNPDRFLLYTNTLQAIAVGYLFTALIILNLSGKMQVISALLLLVAYWVPMQFFGDYTMQGNFAYKVDEIVLGNFRGDLSYTWIWSSLTFTVTVLLGSFAGNIIKKEKNPNFDVVKKLVLIGLGLVLVSLLFSLNMPIIKRIWSGSMTLFAGGICFILMGLFYYMIDYKGVIKPFKWLNIYGMNAIVAYMIGEVVNFRGAVNSVSYGLENILGEFYSVWLTFGNFFVVFIILYLLYRSKIFLKV